MNKINSQRNCKHEYLLRGNIKCSCGRSMAGATCSDGKVRYYRCSGRYLYIVDFRDCEIKAINAGIVEAKVIAWLRKLIENPETLGADLREAQRRQLEAVEPKRGQVESIDALISTAEAELKDNLAMMRGLDEHSRRYKMLQLLRISLIAKLSRRQDA